MSVVLMTGQSEFVTSYMGPWWAGGLGGAQEQALHNFPKFQHCSQSKVYSYPAGCIWLWLSTLRPLCIQQRPYPQWLLSVLKSDNDGVRYPWWWMTRASFVDARNRLYLMLCEVINYNNVISATDSLEFVKDVRFTDV